VRIDLTLPSASMIVLTGTVSEHIPAGGLGGRGPGIDIQLTAIPQSAMWLIETALAANAAPAPTPTAADAPPAPTPAPVVERAAEEGGAESGAEAELIAAMSAELIALAKLNPFQVLGVGYEVTDEEVRSAFGDLTKRYHPDRYSRYQSSQLRSLASEIFIILRDAYRKIGDAEARTQTAAGLGRAPAPRAVAIPRVSQPRAATAPVVRVPTAPVISTVAPITPPAAPAVPPIAQARTITPPVVPLRAPTPPPVAPPASSLGSVDTQRRPVLAPPPPLLNDENSTIDLAAIDAMLDAGQFDQAVSAYRLYAKLHPHDRQARAGVELAEGLKAMANRDRMEAAQRFESVLEIDPSNERAARELAEMRRQATNERKGLLTKLLGKKD
jgi:tetratricopeptide (TPR) repeat protein